MMKLLLNTKGQFHYELRSTRPTVSQSVSDRNTKPDVIKRKQVDKKTESNIW